MNTPFWLIGRSCKKSLTTYKENLPNGDEFCMIAFSARSKCQNVSLPITDISSIIKTFKYWYLLPNFLKSSITWLFILGLQSWLYRDRNAECNVIPLIHVATFPADAVTRTDGCSRFWFLYLRTCNQLMPWLKSFFQCQHLHLKIFEMVWVAVHYSFLLICNAMHTAL